jgi:hypothetical protein
MLAFLIELIILVAVLLCVHQEQRPWVFLIGVIVIITPVWILLAALPICAVGFGVYRFLRLRRKKRHAGAALDRQLTVTEFLDWRSL